MSLLGIGENLPDLVHARFEAARESGALKLASSHLAILDISGTSVGMFSLPDSMLTFTDTLQCQLRYCPELAKKPRDKMTMSNHLARKSTLSRIRQMTFLFQMCLQMTHLIS